MSIVFSSLFDQKFASKSSLCKLLFETPEADPEGGEGGSSPGQILNSLLF